MERFRIGFGFDSHRFDAARKLKLGGVTIPDCPGLHGHSDADVLLHAVIDSMLGAAAMGDIGSHFPDADPTWKDADSADLLSRVRREVEEAGWTIGNIDATILAQKPKLAPHIDEMRVNMAKAMNTDPSRVSVKATTEEGLGFTGAEQGIAAQAVCLLYDRREQNADI